MKNLNLLIVFMFIIALFSCKDDEAPSPSERIIGKWQITASTTTANGVTEDDFADYLNCEKDDFSEFRANGVLIDDEGATKCSPDDPQTVTESWSITDDGETLKVSSTFLGGAIIDYELVSITDTQLVIAFEFTDADGLNRTVVTSTKIP